MKKIIFILFIALSACSSLSEKGNNAWENIQGNWTFVMSNGTAMPGQSIKAGETFCNLLATQYEGNWKDNMFTGKHIKKDEDMNSDEIDLIQINLVNKDSITVNMNIARKDNSSGLGDKINMSFTGRR
jgi:hypothetical protein